MSACDTDTNTNIAKKRKSNIGKKVKKEKKSKKSKKSKDHENNENIN